MWQPVTVPVTPARSPKAFSKELYNNVDERIEHYEQITRLNGWSNNQMLVEIYFLLEDTTRISFKNHEANIWCVCHQPKGSLNLPLVHDNILKLILLEYFANIYQDFANMVTKQ